MSASNLPLRASAWEWAQTGLLAGNLVWTTLCLGGYLAETMVVTSSLTGGLLALHLASRAFDASPRAAQPHPAGWWLLPFLACGAMNVAWLTPVPWLGWRDWFGWVEMTAVFWVTLNGVRAANPRRILFATLVSLGVIVTVLGCYQRFVEPEWMMLHRVQARQFFGRASGSFGIPNSMAALLLLLLPAVGGLVFRRRAGAVGRIFCGWLVLVLSLGLALTLSRGALVAVGFALTTWAVVGTRGGLGRRLGVAVAVLTGLLFLGVALDYAIPGMHGRMEAMVRDVTERSRPIMWRVAWRLFWDHPMVGTGAGSYNVLFEKYRPEGFLDEPQWAHNEYLNTLSDYGLVGLGLLLGAWTIIMVCCLRGRRVEPGHGSNDWIDSPELTAGLGVGLLAFALQAFVDFHFKIPALAMAFAMVAALIVQRRWQGEQTKGYVPSRKTPNLLLAAAVLAATVFLVVPRFRAEAFRDRGREALDRLPVLPDEKLYRAVLTPARSDLARAVELDPANAQAWSDVSYAASLWAHVEPTRNAELGRDAEQAAGRALAISALAGEFWIRRGMGRDMQGRWLEGGADFNHAVRLSPESAVTWYYYAYHLSLDSRSRALAEAALQFCLRLDPGNGPGLALRQRLAISPKAP